MENREPRFSLAEHGNVLVISVLNGHVDGELAALLSHRLDQSPLTMRRRYVVLDLEFVSSMDSRGLELLLHLNKKVQRAGGHQLVICGLNESVQLMLKTTHLDQMFTICADTFEAMRSFG